MKRLTFLAVSVSLLFAPLSFAKLFRTATAYPTGSCPVGAVVRDFNNDHIADIATANSNDKNVSVLLGNGDGTFGPTNTFAVGNGAVAIASGDFNGDGNNDLVVADGVSSVSISLGNGDGTFGPATTIKLSTGTSGIVVADLNGDGKLDIAVAIYGTQINSQGSIAILLGNGDGTFAPAVSYKLNHNAVRLVAADLNGDGKLDLAVALQHFNNPKNGLAVLLGNGDGTFQAPTYSLSGDSVDVTAADFNGDGKMDLAVSPDVAAPGVIEILLGKGDGTFAPPVSYPSGTVGSVVATDFNNDGKVDLLVCGEQTSTLFGNGDGTFGPPTVYAIGERFAVAGFLNRDKVPDVLAGGFDSINVAFGNRDGTLRAGKSYPGAGGSVAAADYNGDGNLDLAVGAFADGAELMILFGDGAGGFTAGPGFGSIYAETIVTADFNGDGKPDLLTTPNYNAVQVYLNNGDGTFGDAITTALPLGSSPLGATTGDLNHDGIPDVVVAYDAYNGNVYGQLSILLGNGDGTFRDAGDLPTAGTGPVSPLIADFNGDGNPDVAIFNESGTTLEIFLGNGDGTFQPPISTTTPGGAGNSAAADLNGDGKLDLVVATSGLSLFLGNGDGTFQPGQQISSSSYGDVQIMDVNGDGRPDIVGALLSSSIEVFLGDGHGGFRLPLSFPIGNTTVGGFVLRDFNGDGRPDLAVTTFYGSVNVLLNTSRHPPLRF